MVEILREAIEAVPLALRPIPAHEARGGSGQVPSLLVKRITVILPALDVAQGPEDFTLPGLRVHPLKGNLQGYWSVSVSGNWRLVFRFDGQDVYDLDLVDYH